VFFSKPKQKQIISDALIPQTIKRPVISTLANADTGTTGHFIALKDSAAISEKIDNICYSTAICSQKGLIVSVFSKI
jgi:hypothetical protein